MKKALLIARDYDGYVKNGITAAAHTLKCLLSNYYSVTFRNKFENIENLESYAIIAVTPVDYCAKFSKKLKSYKGIKVALLSDCFYRTCLTQLRINVKFKNTKILTNLLLIIKALAYFVIEIKISRTFDFIILQTSTDIKRYPKILNKAKLLQIHNEYDIPENVRTNDIVNKKNKFIYVASFEGGYLDIALWFFVNVWKPFLKINPVAKISVLGKGSIELKLLLAEKKISADSIIPYGYVDDLGIFYRNSIASIAPIFKGYGLINKVVEAMANGCVVLGDKHAFNGISGIKTMQNCIIADSADLMVKKLTFISQNIEQSIAIGLNGYSLVKHNFSRNSQLFILEKYLVLK